MPALETPFLPPCPPRDHRKGRTCCSKGGNPNPTSSKAIGSRDPADVPPRARRGSAVPILTTAHCVHATTGVDARVDAFSRCPNGMWKSPARR